MTWQNFTACRSWMKGVIKVSRLKTCCPFNEGTYCGESCNLYMESMDEDYDMTCAFISIANSLEKIADRLKDRPQ